MFNGKTKDDMPVGASVGTSTSLIGAGTTMKGDITSNGDLRIDGTLVGNIHCSAKVVIGANGVVQGDINGQQADIMGKVTGTIKVKDLLQPVKRKYPGHQAADRTDSEFQRRMSYDPGSRIKFFGREVRPRVQEGNKACRGRHSLITITARTGQQGRMTKMAAVSGRVTWDFPPRWRHP